MQGQALLDELNAVMDALLGAIARAISSSVGKQRAHEHVITDNQEVDREATQLLIKRFALLLKESDGEAVDLLRQSGPLLSAALDADACQRIEKAVHRYDFEAALDALASAAGIAGYKI